jgi:hypothetical protein
MHVRTALSSGAEKGYWHLKNYRRQRKTRDFLPTYTLLNTIFPRDVEISWRPLPSFPHPAFWENFPTWKHLFTEPPSTTGTVVGDQEAD